MKRTFEQLSKDINTIPFNIQFKKCRESSPVGYKWITNCPADDKQRIDQYLLKNFLVLKEAYDMYGDRAINYVSVHEKIL